MYVSGGKPTGAPWKLNRPLGKENPTIKPFGMRTGFSLPLNEVTSEFVSGSSGS